MASETLQEFIENRLRAYDPDIDLSSGSPAQDQIVDPIVQRFEPDPFDMDVDKFITTKMRQEFPELNIEEGTGLRDTLIKPSVVLMDPVSREINLIKQSQSLANPELLADSEVDALVANVFVSRKTGGLSTGIGRLYFQSPVAINISVGNVFFTSSGLRFIPTTLQSISAEQMSFNQSGNLFYFDINLTAEKQGSEYNIAAKEIVGVTNLNAAVRATNLNRFRSGVDNETSEKLIERAETSITERSLVVSRGVAARLFDQFNDLKHLQVIGFTDPEMNRDIITGGDLGPAIAADNDGFTEDDGDGDSFTSNLRTRNFSFTSLFPVGAVTNHTLLLTSTDFNGDGEFTGAAPALTFTSPTVLFTGADVGRTLVTFSATDPDNVGFFKINFIVNGNTVTLDKAAGSAESGVSWVLVRPEEEYPILEVLASDEIKVDGDIPIDVPAISWSIRQKVLTVSDIPGGILFSGDQNQIEIQSDQIHIGGASDFYVRGSSVDSANVVLTAIADESPILNSLTGVSTLLNPEFFYDANADFVSSGAAQGHTLVVETGPDAGFKSIVRVGISPTGIPDARYIQLEDAFTATTSGIRYRIVNEIDVNLRQPRTIRVTGEDAQTIQLNQIATTLAAVDFVALGTEVGDTLRLLEGQDKGDHVITNITGVGNKNLIIGSPASATATGLKYEVFKAETGLDFPLIRIKTIDILDSAQQPTGNTIPYAAPIDVRTEQFSNSGRGTKVSTTDAITGIVGSADLSGLSYPLAATTINVSINNAVSLPIVLTGAISPANIVSIINAAVPNIADTLNVSGELRLTLRSLDRWLRVDAAAENANIGLDVVGEDNRQIKSLNNINSWSSAAFNLLHRQDVVSITTGDNTAQFYIVEVQSDRLLVTGFDKEAGRVRFLQPNVNVSMSAGSRSIGKARVYFLEPTSFEVRGDYRPALKNTGDVAANLAVFTDAELLAGFSIQENERPRTEFKATINGAELLFVPDPELKHTVIPEPDASVPNNLQTTNGSGTVVSESLPGNLLTDLGKESRDTNLDFLAREARVGDLIEVTYQPIQGTADLALLTLPVDLSGLTMVLSIDGAPASTITFTTNISVEDDIAEEINDALGEDVAFVETIGVVKYLRFETDFEMIVFRTGTANAVLGFSTVADVDNDADASIDGYYRVTLLGAPGAPTEDNKIVIADPTGAAPTVDSQAQHFQLLRPGVQRLHSTLMNANVELGMNYMDVELVSEGSGDQFNLADDTVLVVTGYTSDGYRLEVVDTNLSFSTEEDLNAIFSRRIITVGQSDRPDLATKLSGQNIQINYDRSSLASSIQDFASADLERVLTAGLLVRHLNPHFINFDMSYQGGSSADVVTADVEELLNDLGPNDRVEASDIQNKAYRRGGTFVQNPLELVAIAYGNDRTISVDRSSNFVTKGRLATFFPGTINVTRESS